jgi:hypothetical protein
MGNLNCAVNTIMHAPERDKLANSVTVIFYAHKMFMKEVPCLQRDQWQDLGISHHSQHSGHQHSGSCSCLK